MIEDCFMFDLLNVLAEPIIVEFCLFEVSCYYFRIIVLPFFLTFFQLLLIVVILTICIRVHVIFFYVC